VTEGWEWGWRSCFFDETAPKSGCFALLFTLLPPLTAEGSLHRSGVPTGVPLAGTREGLGSTHRVFQLFQDGRVLVTVAVLNKVLCTMLACTDNTPIRLVAEETNLFAGYVVTKPRQLANDLFELSRMVGFWLRPPLRGFTSAAPI